MILIVLFGFLIRLSAQQIPFSEFYVSVQTNDFLNRPGKKTALSVSVQVGRISPMIISILSYPTSSLRFALGEHFAGTRHSRERGPALRSHGQRPLKFFESICGAI